MPREHFIRPEKWGWMENPK